MTIAIENFIKKLFKRKKSQSSLVKSNHILNKDDNTLIKNKVQEYAPDFDPFFYQEANPDTVLLDPYFHYWNYGRFEGRYYKKRKLIDSIERIKINNNKENVLIVTHELSRTGCPILSLNIANQLKNKYNLFALPLRRGKMLEEYNQIFDVVLESSSNLLSQNIIYEELSNFIEKIPFKFSYAIINSIVSRVALLPIAKNFIPSISLIHEFASTTTPKNAIQESLLWSNETIFSAQIVLDDNIRHYKELKNFDIKIIPQGKCESFLTANTTHQDVDVQILEAIKSSKENVNTVSILGCGFVDIRKGVDIFLTCASTILKKDTKTHYTFIWAGGGFEPEKDLSYSSYIQDQIIRSGIENEVKFIGEISDIDKIYELSDILLLSSRLDPLPNVAIESMSKGVPVVCFDQTSGIPDILRQYGCGQYCIAPYLDTQKASELIINLTNNKLIFNYVSQQMKEIAENHFNMALYVKKLDILAKTHIEGTLRIKKEYKVLLDENCIDTEFMVPLNIDLIKEKGRAILFFIHSWNKQINLCKPYSGFHPGIYAEKTGIDCKKENPLVNFINNNKPKGEWNYQVLETKDDINNIVITKKSVALHIHCYHVELLGDILSRLDHQELPIDLYVSVHTDESLEKAQKHLDGTRLKVVNIQKIAHTKNGLCSLLTCYGNFFLNQYDFFGHVTTNIKNVSSSNESDWHTFLLEHLLGGKVRTASLILDKMSKAPLLGLVFPEDPRISRWPEDSRQLGLQLAQKLGIRTELSLYHNYPSGTMFWARPEALRPLLTFNFSCGEPTDKLFSSNNSMPQTVERLLPYIVKHCGFECLQTYNRP
ncbi:MAG: rhamnan synthesis F family protein [bacterium]|nr:rhamnan synthesis F family protein [bacterium]